VVRASEPLNPPFSLQLTYQDEALAVDKHGKWELVHDSVLTLLGDRSVK